MVQEMEVGLAFGGRDAGRLDGFLFGIVAGLVGACIFDGFGEHWKERRWFVASFEKAAIEFLDLDLTISLVGA
jgi:hypothetical protein